MAATFLSSLVIMLTVLIHVGRGETGSPSRASRCGERPAANESVNFSLLSRIVGGTTAKKEECPWIASLKRNGKHFCGGTIITNRFILTAAHCISERIEYNVKVVVGDHDFATMETTEQSFSIKAAIKHPNFNPSKPFNYDLAIVELVGRIAFNKNIQPACLPNHVDKFTTGSLCITLGWGRLLENGRLPSSLQQVALPLIESRRCLGIMDTVDRRMGFDTVICAGFPEGGKDACQGDSGGPFLCQRSHGRWVLVGVTSWGLGCARKWHDNFKQPPDKRGSPGVFTDVQRLLDWLSPNLNEEKSDLPAHQVQCSTDDGFLKGVSGEILLPKGAKKYYSNNEKCVWTILVPRGKHILLNFSYFNVEWDYSCDLDYLVIYSALGHLIGKFCGDVRPRPLLITDTSITLKFISDFQEYKTGFSLSYLAVEPKLYPDSECGSVAVILEEGEIQTMNHPQPYSSNANCKWVVHSPASHIIKLNFSVFEVEPSKGCIFDRLAVYHDLQGALIAGTYCGFALPDPILSVSNVMQITFTSDYSVNYMGFRAVISFVPSSRNIKPRRRGKEKNQPRKSQTEIEHFVCGVSSTSPRFNHRTIAKAEEAIPNSWPWHASIDYNNEPVCNGAIVSETFVLTSANCIAERESFQNLWQITAGLHDRKSSKNSQRLSVKQLIVHPQYDVALIHLEGQLQYDSYVHPICLPDRHSKLEPSDLCVLSGWNLNVESSTKLQQQEVPVLLDDVCKTYYGDIPDGTFCAGAIAGEDNSTCTAQSGAPLVCPSNTGIYTIFGILSQPVGYNVNLKPGVYSGVPSSIPWIREIIHSVEGTIETEQPLKPPEKHQKLSQEEALQPGSPPSSDSGSAQNGYVACKDEIPIETPGEMSLVVSGQDSPGVRCQLIVQAPNRHFILLHFKQLNMSNKHFSLVIYEGASSNKTFKAQLTEEKIPIIIKSTSPTVTIEAISTAPGSELHLCVHYTFHGQN